MRNPRFWQLLFAAAVVVWGIFDPAVLPYAAVFGVTIASGQESTSTVLSNKRIIEMSNKITLLEPSSTPLTVLLKRVSKSKTGNEKFEWLEDELLPHVDAANYATDSAADIGTITVDNADYFMKGDIVRNLTTGEQMLCYKAPAGTDIYVTRGYGETTADTVTDDDPLWRIGNSADEGDTSPAAKTTKEAPIFNYTQHFRNAVELTGRLKNSNMYGGNHLNNKRKQRGIEHMKEIEMAFWFGERKLTSGTRSTTRGIETFQAGTNITTQTTLTQSEFETFLRTGFRYGSDRKWLFASRLIMQGVSEWCHGKLQMVPKDKTFGIAITRYLSPHGEVMLVPHPLFEGTGASAKRYSGCAWLLDLDFLKYRNFNGRDTKLFTNIQENDRDGRKDEYRTDCGLEYRMPRAHAGLNGVTAFA